MIFQLKTYSTTVTRSMAEEKLPTIDELEEIPAKKKETSERILDDPDSLLDLLNEDAEKIYEEMKEEKDEQ